MAKDQITQIPVPGGSGLTPTGAMQFQDDWPGLFVRGDDAAALLGEIRSVEQTLKETRRGRLPSVLSEIARMIADDVILRGADHPDWTPDPADGAAQPDGE
jgi:hypothetical protein